jgi:SAM-dependent methyltransferase
VTSDDTNLEEWEKRGILYGNSYKSVLFKKMPDVVNEHFHLAHLKFIFDCMEGIAEDSKILDVGCGYGRITLPLLRKLPKAEITGMDISPTYVSLYKKNTGRNALVGSIENIPGDIGTFDVIICLTVLMYVNKTQLVPAVSNLLRKLNKNGILIIIEPSISGIPFQTGFGLLNPIRRGAGRDKVNTGGNCFSFNEISYVVENADGIIIKEERIPATTLFFLILYVIGKILPQKWASSFFAHLSVWDRFLSAYRLPTIWTFDLIKKKIT